jgi:hypothetical protein
VAFEWVTTGWQHFFLAAAEGGLGVLDPQEDRWLWKMTGTPPISAVVLQDGGEAPRIVTAGLDGFLRAYDFLTGAQRAQTQVGVPVTGLLYLRPQRLWVAATHQSVVTLNADWEPHASYAYQAHHLVQLGPQRVVMADKAGRVVCLQPAGAGP